MKKYALLKAYPIDYNSTRDDNHLFIHVLADGEEYSLAVNIESNTNATVLKYTVCQYALSDLCEILSIPEDLSDALYREDENRLPHYLDYYEQSLFDFSTLKAAMIRSPYSNPLLDTLLDLTKESMNKPTSYVLAYGSLWGPKKERDRTFGFTPGQGLHDIHANQKSPAGSPFAAFDSVHHDGALFFADPEENTAIGVFMLFS